LLASPALAQNPLVASATASSAPLDPERLVLAERLVIAVHADSMLRGILSNVFKSFPGLQSQAQTDPRIKQLMSSLSVGIDASFPDMIHGMVEVYARNLTTKELEDCLAFYDSPSGQTILNKMPVLMSQAMPVSMNALPKMVALAEQDYCSHLACTETERAMFTGMKSALTPKAPPSAG